MGRMVCLGRCMDRCSSAFTSLIGENTPGRAASHGKGYGGSRKPAGCRHGRERILENHAKGFRYPSDIDNDYYQRAYDIYDAHGRNHLAAEVADFFHAAAYYDENAQGNQDDAADSQRDAKCVLGRCSQRVGLHKAGIRNHQYKKSHRIKAAEKPSCAPAQPFFNIVHGAAVIFPVLPLFPVSHGKGHFCHLGHHAHQGYHPHPEHGSWAANGNGRCHACNVAASDGSCKHRRQGLIRFQLPLSLFTLIILLKNLPQRLLTNRTKTGNLEKAGARGQIQSHAHHQNHQRGSP